MIRGKTEPRIFTPPKRELTPETTHGFACIAFAENLMGLKLFPWQEWLLKHALELNEDGTYRFRFVIVLVGRQNGKSLILLVLALWHLFAKGSPEVIATAQDLSRAEAAWGEALDWIEADEELASILGYVNRGNHKLFEVGPDPDDDGYDYVRKYRVASAGRRGARGFSGDLILMDELREHQNWETWGAVVNTMNARPWGQAWAFSNAGDNLSIVLRYLRAQAHKNLDWPDGDAEKEVLGEENVELDEFIRVSGAADMTGFFEWSSNPSSPRTDLEQLAQANPSMDHVDITPNCTTSRALIASLATTPPWQFDTEVRCIWVPMSDLGPFPEGSWMETFGDDARPTDESTQVVSVSVSKNRQKAHIARAAWTADGIPVVGIAAFGPGTDWVIPWLVENRETYEHVIIQDGGAPSSTLIPDIETTEGLPLLKWPGTAVAQGTGMLFDRLRDKTIRHLTNEALDTAALSASVKILGRAAFEIDMVKSPTDAAPLQAVIGALWGLEAVPPTVVPTIYEWPEPAEIDSWLETDIETWLEGE